MTYPTSVLTRVIVSRAKPPLRETPVLCTQYIQHCGIVFGNMPWDPTLE